MREVPTLDELQSSVQPGVRVALVPGHPAYAVSDDGRVWSGLRANEWRQLRPRIGPRGHHRVSLSNGDGTQKELGIHVLVLSAFVGPRPAGLIACHNDGEPTNNDLHNLRWGTESSNACDRVRHLASHGRRKVKQRTYRTEPPALPDLGTEIRLVADAPGYFVTTDGRLFSCWRGGSHRRIVDEWMQTTGGKHPYSGAVMVRVNNRTIYLGRLILQVFVGPCPPGMECCHGDGNPSNNAVGNLRWDTRAGNVQDTIRHGRTMRGSRNHKAKFTEEQVFEIRRLSSEGWSQPDIAAEFSVSRSIISQIVNQKRWTHVGSPGKPVKYTHKLTPEDKATIVEMRLQGIPQKAIAEKFGIHPTRVWQLTRKQKSGPR